MLVQGNSVAMHFHHTKKAIDLCGLTSKDLVDVGANDPGPLTSWYVNVLTIQRRKVIHVTEASTFYTSMIPGIRKSSMRYLGGLVRDVLVETMTHDGLGFENLRELIGRSVDTYAKTSSRQVLGVMNEQAFAFEAFVDDHGGLDAIDISEANKWLNDMIVMALKDLYTPKEAMFAVLGRRNGC